jgi:hypothetical protein
MIKALIFDCFGLFHGATEEGYQEIVNMQYNHFEKTKKPSPRNKQNKSELKKLNELLLKMSAKNKGKED